MRYNPEIEARILAQIAREPDRAIVLPEWAYWKGDPQPWIYVNQIPTRLARHLYGLVVGELNPDRGLVNPPEVDRRNVNPRIMVVTPAKRSKLFCHQGHRYTAADYRDGVGNRCQTCHEEKLLGTPGVDAINRAKTTCPRGHKLIKQHNGKRRCKECGRDRERARRAKIKAEKEQRESAEGSDQ